MSSSDGLLAPSDNPRGPRGSVGQQRNSTWNTPKRKPGTRPGRLSHNEERKLSCFALTSETQTSEAEAHQGVGGEIGDRYLTTGWRPRFAYSMSAELQRQLDRDEQSFRLGKSTDCSWPVVAGPFR